MMNRNSFVQTRQLEKQNIGILLFSEEGHLGLYEDKHLILNVYPLCLKDIVKTKNKYRTKIYIYIYNIYINFNRFMFAIGKTMSEFRKA